MTNAMIIFNEACNLLEEGKIGTTGRVFEFEDADGNKQTMQEPEQIHTFQRWKALGYSVRKGEKAVAKFPIWKCATKKQQDDEHAPTEAEKKMFMKVSAFFSAAQVEPIKANA